MHALGSNARQEPYLETRQVDTDFHLHIGSRFQPIIGLAHRRVVGHEALLVATDESGASIAPDIALASVDDHSSRIALEQSVLANHFYHCAPAMHSENSWLFLNYSTLFLTEFADGPQHLSGLLKRYGLQGSQIVIEVLESEISNPARFIEALSQYRALGCLVAIDDFGSGHSNFDRVCDIAPDMVKLDRKLVGQAAASYRGTHLLTRITQTLHEVGSLVLAEGIETETEALAVMDAGADMAQGYFFARPQTFAPDYDALKTGIDHLWMHYYAHHKAQTEQTTHIVNRYASAMRHVSAKLASGMEFTARALSFMQHLSGVMRLFLLDASGAQLSQNLCAPECTNPDSRYRPLHDTHGATWYRRDYYRSAIAHPGHVQITEPYLSICGNRSCVTLSLCFQTRDSIQILCADIEWHQIKTPADGNSHNLSASGQHIAQ